MGWIIPAVKGILIGIGSAATLGAAGTGAFALAIGAAVVVGGTIALTRLFEIEMPKVDTDRSRQATVKGTTEPYKIIYGETLVSGPIAFLGVAGAENQDLYHVIALAGHEVNDITDIYFDAERITDAQINGGSSAGGNVTAGRFGPQNSVTICVINKHLGTASQAADSMMVGSFSNWTSAYQGKGIAYIATKWKLNEDTQELWDKYMPRDIKAVVQGKKLYDPRLEYAAVSTYGQDITNASYIAYGDNPALCLLDYLLSTDYGMGISSSKIDWSAVVTAADGCDVSVSVPGGSESRFTCNGVLFGTDSHRTNIDKILNSMNGQLSYVNGTYVMRAGIYESPTLSLDENDLIGGLSIKTSLERGDRFNTIKGLFIDPDQSWKSSEFPKVQLADAVTRDNNEILETEVQFPMVNSSYQAQRLANKLIQLSDQQKVVTFPANLSAMRVAVGDRVQISIDELSWSNKIFQCLGWTFSEEGGINLTLREDSSTSYADPAVGEYSTITVNGDVIDAFRGIPSPSGLSATAGLKNIELDWVNPPNNKDFETIHVFASPNQNFSSAVKIGETDGTQFIHDASNGTDSVSPTDTRYYWVRAIRYVGTSDEARSNLEPNADPNTTVFATVGSIEWTDVENTALGIDIDLATDTISIDGVDTATSTMTGQEVAQSGIRQEIELDGGGIVMNVGGVIKTINKDSETDTTNGFFLGYNGTDYTFAVGDATESMIWDGTNLSVTGAITATSLTLGADAKADLLADLELTEEFYALNTINHSPLGNITFTPNFLNATANDGEITIAAGAIKAGPTTRTTSQQVIVTPYEGSTKPPYSGNHFYVIWGPSQAWALDTSARFQTSDTVTTDSGGTSAIFVAIYDEVNDQWAAVDNSNSTVNFTPDDTDYVIAIGTKTSTTGGIDSLKSIIVYADDPEADQTVNALNTGTTITGGGITMSSGGSIKGGQTGYDTGTGFFLGYDSAYKFSIGNSSGSKLTFDGTNLSVTGNITASSLNVATATVTGTFSAANISLDGTTLQDNGSGAIEVKDAGITTAKIGSSAMTPSKIALGAISEINPVTITGNVNRWGGYDESGNAVSVGTGITVQHNAGALEIINDDDRAIRSQGFEVDHNAIYVIRGSFKKDSADGTIYIGATQSTTQIDSDSDFADGVNGQTSINFDRWDKDRASTTATDNAYFAVKTATTSYVSFKVFLLGANVDIDDVPSHEPKAWTGFSSQGYPYLRLDSSAKYAGLRILNWGNSTTTTTLSMKDLSVLKMDSATVVAQNIFADNLAAITADLGTVTAGSLASNLITGDVNETYALSHIPPYQTVSVTSSLTTLLEPVIPAPATSKRNLVVANCSFTLSRTTGGDDEVGVGVLTFRRSKGETAFSIGTVAVAGTATSTHQEIKILGDKTNLIGSYGACDSNSSGTSGIDFLYIKSVYYDGTYTVLNLRTLTGTGSTTWTNGDTVYYSADAFFSSSVYVSWFTKQVSTYVIAGGSSQNIVIPTLSYLGPTTTATEIRFRAEVYTGSTNSTVYFDELSGYLGNVK